MNWLKAFLQKLNAPPSAAGKVYTSTAAAKGPIPVHAAEAPIPIPKSIPDFTPRAQQTLALARKEADRFHHNFVGTEHVLLGLLTLGQGTAVNVMMKMGLSLENVRAALERQVGTGPDRKMVGNIPYTPRVKKLLALAAKEAKALNHTYVGTEHILLGLLREGDGVAARVLKELDVNIETTRAAVLQEIDSNLTASADALAADRRESPPAEPPVDRSELPRDQFTPRVRRAFTLALEEAEQRNASLIETEHVLLGLVRMGQGVAADVLIKIGVNSETVAARIPAVAAGSPPAKQAEPPRFGPLVKEVLSFAAEEARTLEHAYIGTEHILLGLLRQPHGGAARIFQELCVDTEALRKQVTIAFEVKKMETKIGEIRDQTQEPFGSKHTETFTKKAIETNAVPPAARIGEKASLESVDLTQHYDVYCFERNQQMVVYRNVQIKSSKSLFSRSDNDPYSVFVEVEQPGGQRIFIAKSTIIRFCPSGSEPKIENV